MIRSRLPQILSLVLMINILASFTACTTGSNNKNKTQPAEIADIKFTQSRISISPTPSAGRGGTVPTPGPKNSTEPTKEASTTIVPKPSNTIELTGEQKKLMDSIALRYQNQAVNLKNQNLSKLSKLAQQAKDEYNNLSSEEKSKNKSKIYSKYFGLALNLQTECDSKFNDIISQMKSELTINNLPLYPADEAVKQYEAEKRATMVTLAKKYMN